jgi:hypothetical protein
LSVYTLSIAEFITCRLADGKTWVVGKSKHHSTAQERSGGEKLTAGRSVRRGNDLARQEAGLFTRIFSAGILAMTEVRWVNSGENRMIVCAFPKQYRIFTPAG